jgi:hypothetical protein
MEKRLERSTVKPANMTCLDLLRTIDQPEVLTRRGAADRLILSQISILPPLLLSSRRRRWWRWWLRRRRRRWRMGLLILIVDNVDEIHVLSAVSHLRLQSIWPS